MKTKPILSTSILAMLCTAATASALTIDTVTIGDPGNPNDPLTGGLYGGVSYTYAIGKYEVTLNQYREFLEAVAVTDTYGLYHPSMGTNLNIAGISRGGSPGSYAYSVIGDGNRPVTHVSWYDAARFSNWLSNGQPTGLQTVGTTETGSYTLTGNTGLISYNGTGLYRLPSESEWYKAAYYQPLAAGGDADGYWLYPTGSNDIPNSRNGSVSDANSGNFRRSVQPNPDGVNDGYAVSGSTSYSSSQQYLTPVGAFTQADSYYGTFDQGGNVFEWNDAIIFSSSRGLRGGSWGDTEFYLRSSNRGDFGDGPTDEVLDVGFRIATVPEPTVSVSLMLAGGLLLARRKRPSAL
jgi:formylglycine-generating enzyme required for sulfatase activity